jgi:hypothetical protein
MRASEAAVVQRFQKKFSKPAVRCIIKGQPFIRKLLSTKASLYNLTFIIWPLNPIVAMDKFIYYHFKCPSLQLSRNFTFRLLKVTFNGTTFSHSADQGIAAPCN